MPTQVNPYQPPAIAPVVVPEVGDVNRVNFHGSMTMEEGQQADQLMRGKKLASKTDRKMLLYGTLLPFVILAYMGYDAIVYDELDLLLPAIGQLLLVAALFVGVWWYQHNRDRKHAALNAEQRGVFTHVGGQLHTSGVDYLADDFPVEYEWEDFVGCRIADDVILLYLGFPREMNFLAASYFDDVHQWQSAKRLIEQNVPKIGPLALSASRAKTHRMTHIAAGIRHLHEEDWAEAIAEFDQALDVDAGCAQAIRGRLVALVNTQDFDAALEAVSLANEHGIDDHITRRLRSGVLITKEKYLDALADLNWLVEHNPNDFDSLRNRGLVNLKMEHCEASLADLSRAIELNPDDALAFNNRGATLIELNRPDEAIVDLERALEIDPSLERPTHHLDRARNML